MACSVSPMTVSPNRQSYGAFENRGSEIMQPERDDRIEGSLDSKGALSLIKDSNSKDLKSRVVVLSNAVRNAVRNVAIIETTRFLAIVGFVCSAATSVLLPALGFLAIAAGACVLKNRAIQLGLKTLQGSDLAASEAFSHVLKESTSSESQITQENDFTRTVSREGSVKSMEPITEERVQEESSTDIKKAFLDSLGDRNNLNIKQRYDLLTICYSYLLGKTAGMPLYLKKEGILTEKKSTETYFIDKYKKNLDKSSEDFKESITIDGKIQSLQINDKQKLLEKANPSLIMEIVKELHEEISTELAKHENKTEAKRHTDNAKHAEEYITQLKYFESLQKVHFVEDLNKTTT